MGTKNGETAAAAAAAAGKAGGEVKGICGGEG